ncbi:MAG TPA: hypothetical protein DFS52_06450 [Myxococcales bacterium]|jgi:Flp pilus assembly protein TadD|nr:hypothetical protein [Myxococcales bacterium]
MATETQAAKQAKTETEDWRKRESIGSFLRDVILVAVILGVGLWMYRGSVETGKQVRALGKEVKQLMLKDSPEHYVKAEEKLKAMLELDSDFPFAVASLAELYAIRWLDFGIEADASKAREWAKKASQLKARINERFGAEVLARLGEGQFAEAEKFASEISKQAASSHVVNGLGRAFVGQGKLEEAKIALKKAADTEWRNPRFACDIADVYLADGDHANALAFYSKGVESNSDHARSLIGRSRAQIARGQRIKDASDTLKEVLERGDEQMSPLLKAQALVAMSELRMFEQKYDEAAKLADDAIAAFDKYPWSHFARGRAMAALQKAPEAGAAFDKAIELGRYVPEFYYTGAKALLAAGDQIKAPTLLDAYVKAMREDDRLHLAYGDLLMQMNKGVEALEHFQKAIAFNSFNAQAHYAKGAALYDARAQVGAGLEDTKPEAMKRLTERLINDLNITIDEFKKEKWEVAHLEKELKVWTSIKGKGFNWDGLSPEEKDLVLVQTALDELKLALEVQEYFPDAYSKMGDIRFGRQEYADACQQWAQALMQMKQLQRPRDLLAAVRENINTRLIKEAKQKDIAKAWMDETAALVR